MTSTPYSTALDPQTTAEIPLAVAAGRTLILAGAVFGLANLTQWAIMSGAMHVSQAFLALIWPVAVGGFIFGLRKLRRHGGEAALRTAVWSRIAILSQIATALGLVVVSAVTGHWALMMWMSVVGMTFYGVAWAIAALRTRTVWIAGIALGCFCAAGGVAELVGTPSHYLAYACSLAAFVLIPGLVLVFRGRI
ncbi:hypothetical protein BH10PSE1_BH10PSE1_30900 [soil metagenome]